MGDYYYISCQDCKLFASTYKWDGSPAKWLPKFEGSMKSKCVSKKDVFESVEFWKGVWCDRNLNHWFNSLSSRIIAFSSDHDTHELRIYPETDAPWYPEHIGYSVWKEMDLGYSGELFLPRNLIEDLGLLDWSSAESYLKTLTVYLNEDLGLDEYKESFNAVLNSRYA